MAADLDAQLQSRRNNFDFIRLVAALMVMWGHSFNLLSKPGREWISIVFDGSWGQVAVWIFFFLSGFLVTGSLQRHSGLLPYALSRALRILPGLAVVVLLSVFVVGPLLTTLPLRDYWRSPTTWHYLRNLWPLQQVRFELPGVFAANQLPGSVNGSLWTLPVECNLYLVLAACALVGGMRRIVALALPCALIAFFASSAMNGPYGQFTVFAGVTGQILVANGIYFFLGSAAFMWRHRLLLHPLLFFLAAAATFAAAHHPALVYVSMFTLPYCVLCVGFCGVPFYRLTDRLGDLSYGLYIYGFLAQQIVAATALPRLEYQAAMLLAMSVALSCAYISWHCVEKPALTLRRPLLRSIEALLAKALQRLPSGRWLKKVVPGAS